MSTTADWKCSNEEYHRDYTAVGNSMKEVFRKSRKLYRGYYVTGNLQRPEPSDAMLIGSALHCCTLEPDNWLSQFAVTPDVDRRTREGKAEWSQFLIQCEGRSPITWDQRSLVDRMHEAIRQVPAAMSLLECEGPAEHSVRWECGNLTMKCRFDKLVTDRSIIIELKTARDPSAAGFARQAANLGYHRQAAWYQWGHREVYGKDASHVYVVVGTEPPHDCFLYELDKAALDLGRMQNEDTVAALYDAYEHDDWKDPSWGIITTLSLPGWAYQEDAYQL